MSDLLAEVRASMALRPPAVARAIRLAAHVTQDRLARELGVHRVSVQRWEGGSRLPRGEVRARYAAVLAELAEAVRS